MVITTDQGPTKYILDMNILQDMDRKRIGDILPNYCIGLT